MERITMHFPVQCPRAPRFFTLITAGSLLLFGCATQTATPYQVLGGSHSAEVESAYKSALEDLDQSRSLEEGRRRNVVEEVMDLTPDEAKAFWPVYTAYRGEMSALGERMARLVADYAARFGKLQDQDASAMTREYLDIDQKGLDVKKKYLAKFDAVLKPKKVARFFQTDQKLDAGIKFGMAKGIPLIE
jgi:DNA-directed RNA polymerase subunit F